MKKIQTLQDFVKILSSLKETSQATVLVGGCFDILHIGHIKFLKEAKKMGDILVVLIESDTKVKQLKGRERPLFSQKERAEVLAALNYVDYVILLPEMKQDQDYEKLIQAIEPDIIAVTGNDPLLAKKKSQAELVNGRLIIVPRVKTFSSSKLVEILGIE
jgi:rfaE bifunctional protein nucleotidyltransferase chain/domain